MEVPDNVLFIFQIDLYKDSTISVEIHDII